jgi:hypothetical protein
VSELLWDETVVSGVFVNEECVSRALTDETISEATEDDDGGVLSDDNAGDEVMCVVVTGGPVDDDWRSNG